MKAFFGSMTGRVFLTLLLGTVFSAALTQLLAENERQRVIEEFRHTHALDRAEDGCARGGAFGCQRHQGCGVPQYRAIVGATVVEHGPRRERCERGRREAPSDRPIRADAR